MTADLRSRVLYAKPSITALECGFVADAAANGWGERCYEYVSRFERGFAEYLDIPFSIATSSGTGALHLGLSALGLSAGDEVIIGDVNWIASIAPAIHMGAFPVFVDVLPDTWCLDPRAVAEAITPRTRAIIAVHLYGNVCDMTALQALGDLHGIPIIEDAAEAIGSSWRGRAAGTIGVFGGFSFHGTKTLTTGEGGMFVTHDSMLYERALALSNHGRSRGSQRQFWPERLGFKYKMSNVQAALGCAQLERVNELVERKRQIFSFYHEHLADLPVTLNVEPPGTTNGFWMPTLVVEEDVPFDREVLLAAFASENIDGRVFFWPLSSLPMFEARPANTHSYSLAARAVNLPSYHDVTDDELLRVVATVRRVIPH